MNIKQEMRLLMPDMNLQFKKFFSIYRHILLDKDGHLGMLLLFSC